MHVVARGRRLSSSTIELKRLAIYQQLASLDARELAFLSRVMAQLQQAKHRRASETETPALPRAAQHQGA